MMATFSTSDTSEANATIETLRRLIRFLCDDLEEMDLAAATRENACAAPSGEGTHCLEVKLHDGTHVDRRGLNWSDADA